MQSTKIDGAGSRPTADLLDTGAASIYLSGLSVETLKDWRKRRIGPSYVSLGRRVFYRRADLDAFIEANTHCADSASA